MTKINTYFLFFFLIDLPRQYVGANSAREDIDVQPEYIIQFLFRLATRRRGGGGTVGEGSTQRKYDAAAPRSHTTVGSLELSASY